MRLGGGLDADGMLTEDAAQRGLDCLGRFAERLSGFAPQQVRAVATQTLREARNRNAFLLRAQKALGFPIEVISGREEARLIYAGVAHLQPTDASRLVVDIGGRSTEMILGQGRTPLLAESFQVGSVSLSMRFFGDGSSPRLRSAPRRSPPAPSWRKRCSPLRPSAGARRWARPARSARCRSCCRPTA